MSFDNVPVPVENVIGEVGGGFKVSALLFSLKSYIIFLYFKETVKSAFFHIRLP